MQLIGVVNTWLAASRPEHPARPESFERWSNIVGDFIQNADILVFMESIDEL